MKKTNDSNGKRPFSLRVKRFFKHYFGLLMLALACALMVSMVIFYSLV